ncbi:MAG: ABC transporter ATP-binding protein [Nocardiopsaceae bacterium]|nr:ABC transporter ATP-binding protein [Nocardiopsaceae bacterium]
MAKSIRLPRPGRRSCGARVLRPAHRPPRPLDPRGRLTREGTQEGIRDVTTAVREPGTGETPETPLPGPDPEITAINTKNLKKTYKSPRGNVEAVRGIDLDVPRGEFFGLLGPNGAGKSTTIGMLTTLVAPTGGTALVAGRDVVADPVGVKRRIGVVTQNNTLDMQLTVAENLQFRSRFFGLSSREASRRAAQLIDAFGLGDRRKALAHALSGGQARRLLIARALVHKPDVLFLDEPTAGLDPQTRVNLWEILRVLHAEGQTVLLTTHHMEEAEQLCDRVAIVDHGRVLAEGGVDELKQGAGAATVVTVRFEEQVQPDFPERMGLTARPSVSSAEVDGDQVRVFSAEPDGLLGELVELGAREGLHVRDAAQLRPSLETVFLALTGREYRE